MAIFGHLDPLANGTPSAATASDGRPASVWGPSIAEAGGLLAVVQGTPSIDGAYVTEADAAAHLLAIYRKRKFDFLKALGGQFALAIVDRVGVTAVLAVDPMGIGRLAYSSRAGALAFGTSAEEVARALGTPRVSRQAIFDYLVNHMVPAPLTVFEGVQKLRGGTCAVFRDGRLEVRRYWNPSFVEHGHGDFEPLAAELHAALRNGVRDAGPDKCTGAFLSGGLDSSTVVGVLSEVGPAPAQSFSIGFGYPAYDELRYARIANERFGARGHEYVVTGDDIASAFALIARAYDEPFGNSSALPAYHCARFARESGITHLLAGDGGDELFAGNSRYARQSFFQRYQWIPEFLRRGFIEPTLRAWPVPFVVAPIRKARNYVERASTPLPQRLELWNLVYRIGPAQVLHPDFLSTVDTGHPDACMQEVWDSAPCRHTLNRLLFFDWQYTLADNDLRKVETMCDLAGVRVSYPMLHDDVIRVASRVPPSLMMPGTRLRDFYKRAMAGFLPDEIIHKTKHGFGLPFGLWLQDSPHLRELIMQNLRDLEQRQVIHPKLLDRLLHLHGAEDAEYYGVFVWVLAMLEEWFKEHRLSV
jgi:asparagine synthase (glutamine-hydrolysing)